MSEKLPLFPLGTVLFPGIILPLRIFEERYRLLLRNRTNDDPIFGVILTRSGREVGDEPEIHEVGTAASILKATQYPDGRFDVAVHGGRRFRVLDGDWSASYLVAKVEWIDLEEPAVPHGPLLRQPLGEAFEAYLDALERVTGHEVGWDLLNGLDDPVRAGYAICSMMPFALTQRQHLLGAVIPDESLGTLQTSLRRERELLLATGIGGAADRTGSRFLPN